MIIVTGATGQLGSQIVERLLERVSADEVGVSVRDVDRAGDLAARAVRVRRGDFADPSTLEAAFEGASQVLVISVDRLGEQAVAQHTAAIDAGYRAGAHRVLYTSHQAASPDSSFAPARDHAATEAYLVGCDRPFTSLRNGFYTTSLAYLIAGTAQAGELVAPADGPVSWTTPADLAEAAATILAADARFDGPTPPLTASDAVDLQDVAAVLSKLSGRAIRRVVVDDEDYVGRLVDHGTPEPAARLFLGMFHAARRGEFAVTGSTLQTLIGREPQPIRAALEATGN
jgi:NAD(P)H dehydrogenase (quinone)